jgi:hypothetical protein
MNALVDIAAVPVGPVNLTATVVGLIVCLAFAAGIRIGGAWLMGRPKEARLDSGFFLFIPIWGWLFVHLGQSYLDRAGAMGIWLFVMGCGFVGFLWLWIWARFVPSFVSWWLAGFVWVITLWLAVTGRFA